MADPLFKTEKRWFVRNGSHVDGPHPTSRILEWRREGRLPADVLLSADGQRWQRVRWPASARDGRTPPG